MSPRASESPLRVLVVDDHPIVREGIAALFRREEGIEVVGAVGDGAGCLQLINEERPDVLLLDLHLPDMSGIELVRRIRAEVPELEIVVLTGYDYLPYRRRLRVMGVERVLSKAAREAEIVATVRAAGAREPISILLGPTGLPGGVDPLTPREYEVLEMLAEGKRNGEVAEALCVSIKTVEFHVSNVLSKLGARSRTDAVLKAQQKALLPPPIQAFGPADPPEATTGANEPK